MSDPLAAGGDTTQPGGQADDPAKAGASGNPDATQTEGGTAQNPDGALEGDKAPAAELKFELPEGVAVDEARLGEFNTIAKELGLSQEAAQKLVTWEANRLKAQADAYVETQKGWLDEVKADKAVGGEKLPESTATALKAIALGPPGLKEFLNDSGLGNHPLLFKWAHAIGTKLSEDTIEHGAPPKGTKPAYYERSPELR